MNVRPSPIAGLWYPGQEDRLRQVVHDYLSQVEVQPINGRIQSLLVPHAGLRYSGQVAAYAFKYIADMTPDLVIVISPYHRHHHTQLLTTGHDAYETPLGQIAVDRKAQQQVSARLQDRYGLDLFTIQNDPEHAVEIELPFLQVLLNEFKLLPIMMRDQSANVARALGDILSELIVHKKGLLIASSDLSHFYHQVQASAFDQEMLRRVAAFDPQAVMRAEQEGRGYACGRGAIAAMLWASRQLGCRDVRIVRHATSGDVTNDLNSVVGYGAAVVWSSA